MIPSKPTNSQTGLVVLAMLGIVAVLHFAKDVLAPGALALMLAFLLAPLVSRVERWGASRTVAVVLTTFVAFASIGGVVYTVANQFVGLIQELPSHRDNLIVKIKSLSGTGGGGIERSVETVKELNAELQKVSPGTPNAPDIAKVQIVEPPPNAAQVVRGLFGPLVGPVSTAAIVVVFVLFMLIQREEMRDRLVRLLGAGRMHTTIAALDDAGQRVSRYLLMQTLVNTIQGTLVAAGLYAIGVPDALLWGALTIVLRFVPYLGPMLAAAGPIALSLAVSAGWNEPLMVVGLIVTLELITNNVLEPRLYGSSVGVSSFALIVAAVFWTWLWGVTGLFLATPLTVCLAVMGKYIPQLEFVAVILSDQPALEPRERFYQRLLANDSDEALDMVVGALQTDSLLGVCDTILLPALRFIEQDHERGAIDTLRRSALIEQLTELVDDLPDAAEIDLVRPDAPGGKGAAQPPGLRMAVLCLPAGDQADALAAHLLARLLAPAQFDAESVGVAALKGEMLERVEQTLPDAICISATPPGALIHARYLCKKLRSRFEEVPIVVALWDAQGDLQKATERLASVGANKVVTSAAGAIEELTRLRQPMLQGVSGQPVAQDAIVRVPP
jgi:predicted PurR-regulated permease PerM